MKQTIVYVGLDVDDTRYHGSALDKNTGEVIDFRCRPTLKGVYGEFSATRRLRSEAFLDMMPWGYLMTTGCGHGRK